MLEVSEHPMAEGMHGLAAPYDAGEFGVEAYFHDDTELGQHVLETAMHQAAQRELHRVNRPIELRERFFQEGDDVSDAVEHSILVAQSTGADVTHALHDLLQRAHIHQVRNAA